MAFTTKDPKDTYLAILNLGDANEVLHATIPEPVLDAAGTASLLELSQNAVFFTGIMEADVASGFVMDAGIDFTSDAVITDILKDKTDTDVGIHFTAGDPEASLSAKVGSIALRRDGSVGATMYVKETGTGNTGWEVYETFSAFLDLSDTPGTFTANKWVKVNAGGTALEWVAAPTGAETFVALTDTPANFTSAALKILRVNSGATAVEFVTPFAETFLALGDTPGAFVANKMVKVNTGNTALEFGDLFVTSSPARGEIMFYSATGWANLGVGAAGEVLSSGGAGADPTWESALFPSAVQGEIVYYNGAAWLALGVGSADQVLTTHGAAVDPTWEDVSADVIDLGDTPADYSSDGDIVYTNGTDAWAYQTIAYFLASHLDEPAPVDGEILVADSGGGVGIGWKANTFIQLSDTQGDYSGATRALLAVNTGESDIEWVAADPDANQILWFDGGSGNWAAGRLMITGTGSPEGSVDGSPGDFYTRSDGSTTDVLYVKATGSDTNTGWALVTSTTAT